TLGRNAEVYDAELHAATAGLELSQRQPGLSLVTRTEILLDNQAAATRLQWGQPGPLDADIVARFNAARRRHPTPVQVKWVPGHTGIQGNERADALAKAGTELPQD